MFYFNKKSELNKSPSETLHCTWMWYQTHLWFCFFTPLQHLLFKLLHFYFGAIDHNYILFLKRVPTLHQQGKIQRRVTDKTSLAGKHLKQVKCQGQQLYAQLILPQHCFVCRQSTVVQSHPKNNLNICAMTGQESTASNHQTTKYSRVKWMAHVKRLWAAFNCGKAVQYVTAAEQLRSYKLWLAKLLCTPVKRKTLCVIYTPETSNTLINQLAYINKKRYLSLCWDKLKYITK